MPDNKSAVWFLRKKDNSVFGPVSIKELARWAEQCRVVAGNEVSTDQQEWIPVETLDALQMHWTAERQDGKQYGPFPLSATAELFKHKVLPRDAVLTNHQTGETRELRQVLDLEPADIAEEPDADAQQEDSTTAEEDITLPSEDNTETHTLDDEDTTEKVILENASDDNAIEGHKTASSVEAPTTTPPITDNSSPDSLELETTIDDLSRKLERSEQKARQLATAQKALESQLAEQQKAAEDSTDNQDELDQLQEACTQLKSELNASRQEQDSIAQLLAQSQQQTERLEQSNQDLRNELEEAEKMIHEARKTIKTLRQETGSVSTESRHQTAFMKKNIAALTAEIEQSRAQISRRGRIITIMSLIFGILVLWQAAKWFRKSSATPSAPATAERPNVNENQKTADNPAQPNPPDSTPLQPTAHLTSIGLPTINIEGATAVKQGTELIIRFHEGIFARLDELAPEAKTMLRTFADQVRQQARTLEINIEGHTDSTPMRSTERFPDNAALARARAKAVESFLIREVNIPPDVLTIVDNAQAPYPNNTAENRKRNRTAVIRIRPKR